MQLPSRAGATAATADGAGTLETLARELSFALEPLQDTLGPAFFLRLGCELPREISDDAALLSSLGAAQDKARALTPKSAALTSAITDGDDAAIVSAGADVLAGVAELVTALTAVGTAVGQAANALAPPRRALLQDLATRLAARTVEAMLVTYLGERWPSLTTAMDLLGLVDRSPQPSTDMDVIRSPRDPIAPRLHVDRLSQLVMRPADYLRETFEWGAADFDGAMILPRLQALLESLGVPAMIYASPGQPPSLEAFVFGVQADTSVSPPGLTFAIAVPGNTVFDGAVDFSDLWKATVHVQANYAAGLEVSLRPPFSVSIMPPSGTVGLNLQLGLKAEQTGADPLVLFGVTGGSGLQARRIGGTIGVDASLDAAGGTVTPTVELRIDGGTLVLKSSDGDGFVEDLLSGRRVEVDFDLAADWSARDGLSLHGQVGGEVFIPASLDVSAARINGIYVSVGLADSGALAIDVSTRVTANLGPVVAVIDRVGVESSITFPQGGGNLGVADLDLGFKPPSGVGLSVEAQGVLTGGGFLLHDPAQGMYAGVMQLSLHDAITLTAYGIIATRMPDGGRGYSLLVFITADGFKPIPLGFGFVLQSIGGMLGVNRTFDQDVLKAGLKTDALSTLLFPRDPVGNAPALIQALAAAFPPRRGSYLLGLLARITWFTPTLVQFDLALIVELGVRTRLLVLGRVSSLLPSRDNDLIRLNLDAMGVIDFDASTLAIDAVLVDSRLVHQFPITGAAAVRAQWADAAGASFVLAVGGVNPRFAPPAGFPALERVAIALSSGKNPRIVCDAYLAITANTVQFGARASLYAEAAGFSVAGDIGYDALVTLLPPHFLVDFHASMQLKRGSHNLFKVTLDGTLEGPLPLRVAGRAKFEILWCSFTVRVDFTLASGTAQTALAAVALVTELTKALADPANWSTRRAPGLAHGVALRPLPAGAGTVLDPLGQLMVQQQAVPLNTNRDVDTFGGAPVAGPRRFQVTATLNGQAGAPVAGAFAPARYFVMSDDDKLAAPSFEAMDAGMIIGDAAVSYDTAAIVAAPLDYFPITLAPVSAPGSPSVAAPAMTPASAAAPRTAATTTSSSPPPLYSMPFESFQRQPTTGAAARVPIRRVGRARFRYSPAAPAATVAPPRWRIVRVSDGVVAPVAATVTTWSEYRDTLAALNRGGAEWLMAPIHELDPTQRS